jgi:hypothetical protein
MVNASMTFSNRAETPFEIGMTPRVERIFLFTQLGVSITLNGLSAAVGVCRRAPRNRDYRMEFGMTRATNVIPPTTAHAHANARTDGELSRTSPVPRAGATANATMTVACAAAAARPSE